ncbi:MAG: hypothetical protein IPP15_06890 [Saprospiraceae bacterium]|uniref:Uncharacterized protein n=1 Tax=Candidatus Opimibacter skivensis TaxID=2982028 RepID=A0A9D7STR8_9BACT|nr:hypothetical protein [Candidatus Opimibacter skivensis]
MPVLRSCNAGAPDALSSDLVMSLQIPRNNCVDPMLVCITRSNHILLLIIQDLSPISPPPIQKMLQEKHLIPGSDHYGDKYAVFL